MKILVNTRLLLKNKLGGIGWFEYQTLKRITCQHPEHTFIFLFDRKFDEEFIFSSNIEPVVIAPPSRHPVLWYVWFEYSVAYIKSKTKPDLFLSPDGHLSLNIKDIPSLPVIHDINFHHRPLDLPFVERKYYQYYFPRFASMAKRIGTVSEFSKQDVASSYCISPDKIDVMYNGANELYIPVNEEQKIAVKKMIANDCDYFIYVGVMVPRKNIARMLVAYNEFKRATGSSTKFILIGDKLFMTKDIEKTYQESAYKNDIVFLPYQTPEKLRLYIGAALALVLVSNFEGFGIPLVEAMQCNVPLITSDVTSMPEIAGEAAIYAQPDSVDSIKNAMMQIACNEQLRADLIKKVKIQKQLFSWDKSANALWNSIEKCFD